MRFAAIDIGSNAVRLLVKDLSEASGKLVSRKVSFIRIPIRLGDNVFGSGSLSSELEEHLVKAMTGFRYLIEAQEVSWFRACATSSLREANNRSEVIRAIQETANIRVECISGEVEADLIFKNFKSLQGKETKDYLSIDVGGGSTELTLIRNGKRIRSQSFQLGTVRALKNRIPDGEWDAVAEFVKHVQDESVPLIAIGTGGNINRYHRLSRIEGQSDLPLNTLRELYDLLQSFSTDERIKKFGLKPDRADVIVPAGKIYIRIMEMAQCEAIYIPKVGLSDGIILDLWEAHLADENARAASKKL